MERCDYCKNRFTWDCEDSWRPSDVFCNNFVLDFSQLSQEEQEYFQYKVMNFVKWRENDG